MLAAEVSLTTSGAGTTSPSRGSGSLPLMSFSYVGGWSVLQNLAALHHDVAVGFDVALPAAVDRDVFALDGDGPILLHRDARVPGLYRHRVAGVDDQVLAYLQRIVLPNTRRPPPRDRPRLIAA